MRQHHIIFFLLISLLSFNNCDFKEDRIESKSNIRNYIFLGHIYQSEIQVDDRVADIDFSVYEQIWLGGDLCAETTSDIQTIQYLDDLFDLSSPKTHWSLGNHDVRSGNINFITDATGRPTYYTTNFDGITLLILNTNFYKGGAYDKNEIINQFELIQNVCDTIVKSSHLIILSHHSVWNYVDKINDLKEFANGDLSTLSFSIDPNLKYDDGVYPLLKKVSERGVKVIHIAGDFGQNVSHYEFLTSDNIQFIGSGITANTDYQSRFPTNGSPDMFLVLHHNITERTITWSYKELK